MRNDIEKVISSTVFKPMNPLEMYPLETNMGLSDTFPQTFATRESFTAALGFAREVVSRLSLTFFVFYRTITRTTLVSEDSLLASAMRWI